MTVYTDIPICYGNTINVQQISHRDNRERLADWIGTEIPDTNYSGPAVLDIEPEWERVDVRLTCEWMLRYMLIAIEMRRHARWGFFNIPSLTQLAHGHDLYGVIGIQRTFYPSCYHGFWAARRHIRLLRDVRPLIPFVKQDCTPHTIRYIEKRRLSRVVWGPDVGGMTPEGAPTPSPKG